MVGRTAVASMGDTYQTDYLYGAAHLICQGLPLLKTERDTRGRVVFHFGSPDAAAELDRAYTTNRAPLVNPKQYELALFRVRDAMRTAQR